MRSKPTFSLRPRDIRTVAVHEYIVNVRRPGFIFFTLLIPALGVIGLIIAGFFSGQASNFFESQFTSAPKVVGVVDQTGLFLPIAPEFAGQYRAFADEAAARQALVAKQGGGFILIPPDHLKTGEGPRYLTRGFLESVPAPD